VHQDAKSAVNLAGPPVSGGNIPEMSNKSLRIRAIYSISKLSPECM